MNLKFSPLRTDSEIKKIARMADEIWHEYWPGLIGNAQVDYMVEKFQSVTAFTEDIRKNGYEYWFLEHDGRLVGYTGGRQENDKSRFFISKVYLYADERGKKFASQVIRFYEDLCHDRNLDSMYLTVNKHNELALRAYIAKGFEVTEGCVVAIGEGYVMDDYIMEKKLTK